ncbi:MAG: hypothetical protein AAFQ82_18960 [Myxococcota bacterium]
MAVLIALMWWASYFVFSQGHSQWKDIGDAFNTLNTLFSGFAFAALVITLWLQKKSLDVQRSELRHSTEQLAASAEAQKALASLQVQQLEMQRENLEIQLVLGFAQLQDTIWSEDVTGDRDETLAILAATAKQLKERLPAFQERRKKREKERTERASRQMILLLMVQAYLLWPPRLAS